MRNKTLLNTLGAAICAAALLIATPAIATQSPAAPATQPPATPTVAPAQPDMPKAPAVAKLASASADARFVMQAAEGGMMEVAKGKLAAQKGAHEGVKQFGQKMVDDHSKVGDELKSIASGKSITLPGDATKSPMHAMLAKLEKLEGAAFDRAYVEDQIRDHAEGDRPLRARSEDGQGRRVEGVRREDPAGVEGAPDDGAGPEDEGGEGRDRLNHRTKPRGFDLVPTERPNREPSIRPFSRNPRHRATLRAQPPPSGVRYKSRLQTDTAPADHDLPQTM